jgi:hypothetical protein
MSASLPCMSWNSPIGLAELLALVHEGQHHVHAGGHDAERPAGEHGALVVEAAHQHVDAAPDAAEDVLHRDFAVVEDSGQVLEPRMPSLSSFWPLRSP